MLGLYEKNVLNILKSIRGDCFFDVGANTGFYSLLLRHNFRQVYAIEPVPTSARRLKRRLSIRFVRNVKVVPVALSDRNGRATFYVNSEPSADLVKIDVEGAEFLVLEGMRESFAKQRVRNILVELHDRDRKEELETVLKSNLAHVFWVDNQHIYGSRDTAVSTRGNPVEFL